MRNIKLKYLSVCCIFLALFALASISALNFSINRILHNNSERSGVSWAQHLAKHVPQGKKTDIHGNLEQVEAALRLENFARLALDIVGNNGVFQIDFINSDCYCSISLGSYDTVSKGALKEGLISFQAWAFETYLAR